MVLEYMDNLKNDNYYISKALSDIEIIETYTKHLQEYEELISDDMLLDAVMFRLIQLIENIKKISHDFKDKHPDIPWGEIIGFRNGVIHEYGKTDYTVVYEIIKRDLSKLKEALEN